MDKHTAHPQSAGFEPGSSVVYALHGKCTVVSVESRTIGSQELPFYKLEVQKSALSRSTRQEPAIWIPVASAVERGVRAPLTKEDAENVLSILMSREYYFPLNETWNVVQPKLEAAIRLEGGAGLAKVYSYLAVLKKRHVVPPSEITRFSETVSKLMMRELTETLHRTPRSLDEQIQKGIRLKLAVSH